MHEGHRERKRNHALNCGFENMEPHEIIEILLYHSIPRSDTNPIAHRLIDRFGSFDKVFDAEYRELCEVPGVGKNSAFLIKLVPELIRRYEVSKIQKSVNLGVVEDLEMYVKSLFIGKSFEQLYCICLSSGKNVVSTRLMYTGFADHIDFPFQEIIKEVISRGVKDVVIAHNHPYGSPAFSNEDCILTLKLAEALEVIGVKLTDHYLVCENECISFFRTCS